MHTYFLHAYVEAEVMIIKLFLQVDYRVVETCLGADNVREYCFAFIYRQKNNNTIVTEIILC